MHNGSEIARLLESIRLSYESAYGALHGPAMVGKHEFISKKMENIHQDHEQLKTLLGADEAIKLVAQTLEGCGEITKKQ